MSKPQNSSKIDPVIRPYQKLRACELMDKLGLPLSVIAVFREKNKLPYYVGGSCVGNGRHSAELMKRIREFEESSGGLVYAVTNDLMPFARTLNLLFVSKYEEDWQYDLTAYPGNVFRVYAYVYNLDKEYNSESGSVYLHSANGTLERVG